MLPDLRFVLGAAVATAILGVTALGLATSVRLAHQAKISPLEASRSLAFAERADWDQYPDGARRFEELLRRAGTASTERADEPSPTVAFPRSALFWPVERMRGPDDVIASAPERTETVAAIAKNPPPAPSEEPQATGTIAPRATEPPSEPAANSAPDATASDSPTTVAAVTPNPEAAEPASAQENAAATPPQLRKAATRKRAKRPRTARLRQVNQHASTGYPITPARKPTPVRKQRDPLSELDAQ